MSNDDLRTFPSIRALARHMGINETTLRMKLGRYKKTGTTTRGPTRPMMVMEVPTALEERLAQVDRRLVEVLVRLDGLQLVVRNLLARLDDEDL